MKLPHAFGLGRSQQIIRFIVSGNPDATAATQQCFCPSLLSLGFDILGESLTENKPQNLRFST
ncbi:hypothetical protein GX645_06720 [Candidatus Sumerlaeota bacterium]|nr:hypothetical protein [Candidatus Sumerlaeales bacterium]NLD62131.1 hypothetical protein [Candidatus Sumerlaeota bacterium]